MRKRKRNTAEGLTRLKFLAGKLAGAKDLPKSTRTARDFFGYAATVPTSAESLQWLAWLLQMIADGESLADLLHEPRRPGRPDKLFDKALEFAKLCAKGMSDADAATAVGGNRVTLRRYTRKHFHSAPTRLCWFDLFSGLTAPQIAKYRKRFQTGRARAKS